MVVRDEPLVIGMDSSTQSTKAIAWNRAGEAVAEGRADVPMDNPRLDHYEQNPEHWWSSACEALRACAQQVEPGQIAGLSISNQRETLAWLDADGESVHPATLWLDERARVEVDEFSQAFGVEDIHRITGRMPDVTPCLYTLVWMRKYKPEVYRATRHFVDVQAYLVQRLCGGPYRTGWISADPMGFYDLLEKRWSAPLLKALDIDESRLPEACPPGTLLGRLTESAAAKSGLPAGLPVFAAGGDGQCAGLGTNCTIPDRAYVNLGTAVVSGIWSPEYRYGRSWRTELAAQGEGYIFENCLRSGAFLVNWFVERFVARGKANAAVFESLERAAAELPIGSEGLLVQPYFSGVMDPHWDSSARGVILGLSGSHGEAHIYRAILESITLDLVMRTFDMEEAVDQKISHFVAIGGGANSPLWRQMLADASGKPVHISGTVEASALGAGMIAAAGVGWFSSISQAAEQMAGKTSQVLPDPAQQAIYGRLLDIYRSLYQSTATLNRQMVTFARDQRESRA